MTLLLCLDYFHLYKKSFHEHYTHTILSLHTSYAVHMARSSTDVKIYELTPIYISSRSV